MHSQFKALSLHSLRACAATTILMISPPKHTLTSLCLTIDFLAYTEFGMHTYKGTHRRRAFCCKVVFPG